MHFARSNSQTMLTNISDKCYKLQEFTDKLTRKTNDVKEPGYKGTKVTKERAKKTINDPKRNRKL